MTSEPHDPRSDDRVDRETGSGPVVPPAVDVGRRWWRWLLAGLVIFIVAPGAYVVATWPDVRALARRNPETTAFIERYRVRQRERGADDHVAWAWVPWGRISPHLVRAVVAGEDLEFFTHHGFSTAEMRAALRAALEKGQPLRGASTITQQLAKNLWLTPSRNPWRKVKEAILTRQLERDLTKRRILEVYLNVVEFGPGIYGVEAAARGYFAKPARALTPHEAALLAAALPRPSTWHPGQDAPGYLRYAAEIERRMARASFLWRYVDAEPAATLSPAESLAVPSGQPESLPPGAPPPDSLAGDSASDTLVPRPRDSTSVGQ